MNIEEIKVGETYNVRMRVNLISHGIISAETVLEQDGEWGIQCGEVYDICVDEAESFSPIPTPPKHDPCRLFRKGDRVKPRSVFGRKLYIKDVLYEVMWDESCNKISVKDLTSAETLVGMPSVFFELVTPVEELEPYSVQETMSHDGWQIVRDGLPLAIYDARRHPNAKAAAEAEAARLNAEWRKEQNND